MEKPIKMDDLGVPLLLETPMLISEGERSPHQPHLALDCCLAEGETSGRAKCEVFGMKIRMVEIQIYFCWMMFNQKIMVYLTFMVYLTYYSQIATSKNVFFCFLFLIEVCYWEAVVGTGSFRIMHFQKKNRGFLLRPLQYC